MGIYAAWVDYEKHRPWKDTGTGDDSHEWCMYLLPLYQSCNALHHLQLKRDYGAKVVVKEGL